MTVQWKDPSWFRSIRGWAISWWLYGRFHRITVLGLTFEWYVVPRSQGCGP